MVRQFASAFALVTLSASIGAQAAPIAGPGQITYSGQFGVESVVAGSFEQTIDGILDSPGIGGIENGVSVESLPLSVVYNFDGRYDLTTFKLQTEVGANSLNAIRIFELTFFAGLDASGSQIGGVFRSMQTESTTLQSFDIGRGGYAGVASFRFTPITAPNDRVRVEWSEIQFDGSVTPVPEPTTALSLALGLALLSTPRLRKWMQR
ncbi:MAG: PEP-CTERM sorting domain-containing protein [Aquabacterium sp.]